MKKRLTQSEEFEIMKLVLDKFLWVGTLVMLFGLYKVISGTIYDGIYYLIAGIIILFLLLWIVIKEFEIIR